MFQTKDRSARRASTRVRPWSSLPSSEMACDSRRPVADCMDRVRRRRSASRAPAEASISFGSHPR